ncbi:CNNM domain-containing protein [Blastomonas sp.]|uniref:CNNM domain-containing protein n=1 Tax=Blastomonas sp. TaxID=1909299 RepID=UPI00359402F2
MTLLFIYVGAALSVSFLCSLLEASLLTITPSAIQTGKTKGARWAEGLDSLKRNVDRPLAAILTLNTVAHTMGAAGAGAEYARLFGNSTQALFAAALTVAVLILTEIIPKTIGARYALTLAPFVARVLPVLILLLAPLVWFSQQLTRLITFGQAAHAPRHREELMAVARMGSDSGQLHKQESEVLHNLLQLSQVKTWDIMTPRTVVFSLPLTTRLDEFVPRVRNKPFTRIPMFESDPADIKGFVIKGEVLMHMIEAKPDEVAGLQQLMRPISSTLGTVSVDRLFQRFIEENHHIMLVVDEYGSALGIVTLEDVVETIFGFEIIDEVDKVPDMQAYARQLWKVRAERIGIEPADAA